MRSRSIERSLAALLVLGLCEVAAAAGWTAPVRVRTVDAALVNLEAPEIAVNGKGDAIVVWEEAGVIQGAVRAPGGQFSVVSPALSSLGATEPRVGIDAAGRATVAWTRGSAVQTNTQLASGLFGGAQGITGAGAGVRSVELAVDGSGRAVALWVTAVTIWSSVRSAADAPFGTPTNLILGIGIGDYESAAVANTRGDIVGAVDFQSPLAGFSAFSWSEGGGSFLGRQSLSPPNRDHLQLAVGAQGDAAAVWKEPQTATPDDRVLKASFRPAGGTFTPNPGTVVPGTGIGSENPTVAVDASGNALVFWSQEGVMRSAFRPAGGNLGASQDVPGTTGGTESRVVFTPDGTAVAAFFQADVIAATVRPPGGTFGPATDISPIDSFAFDVRLASDDEGNVLAAWFQSTLDDYAVGAAFYDPVPPRIEGLVVPATARVGQTVDVSVAPVDRVGPVSILWDFGNGATAATASASHVFATAGSFPVAVTATDAGGNQSSQTATVVVSLCTSADDCRTVLNAALPDPGAVSGRARRIARRLGALSRKTYAQLAKALRSPGSKQARLHRRAAASLDQLLAVARAADSRARLGVPLAPIEEAAAALKSFVPAG